MDRIGYVSLFSGAMGLDLGLEQAGFEPLVCNEIDAAAVKTIRRNRPSTPVVTASIADVSGASLEKTTGRSLKQIRATIP